MSSITPYILVDKYTYITEVAKYTQRHALLMSLPYTIISSCIFNFYMNTKIFKKKIALFFIVFVCATNFFFFQVGIFKKINDYLFLKSLTNLFILNKEIFFKKNVHSNNYAINLFNNKSNMQFQESELIYSYFLAYKKNDTYIYLTKEKENFRKIPAAYLGINYIFQMHPKIKCYLYVNINSDEFIGNYNMIRNVLSFKEPLIKINYYEDECLN